MPTILLVRHGQASFGGPVYDELSELGHHQARLTAEHLAGLGLSVERVLSGTLTRQQDTAQPAGEAFGVPVELDPRLNEYEMDDILGAHAGTDVRTTRLEAGADGAVTSESFQDLLDVGITGWIAAGAHSPAAENWPAFTGRVRGALTEFGASLGSGQTGLAFTSGGVIAAAAIATLSLPDSAFLTFNRVTVNAAVTKLIHGRRGSTLISFNEHGHLERAGRGSVTYR